MLFFKNVVSQSGNTCYHEKGSTTLTNILSSRLCGLFTFSLFNGIFLILRYFNGTEKTILSERVGSTVFFPYLVVFAVS